ncbi:MAG: MarR family winged helix-turn-helix transcriptional regulator [Proteobacteria bacterium]|nr:MarR family winged helix-turn-helix transcriptional regulator [Pseudomonadota bacterium]
MPKQSTLPAPSPAKPRGCTFLRLRKLTRRITQRYEVHLQPSGLRITQFSLLATLAGADGMSISDLAAQLAMDRTTLTRNLRPLISASHVELGAGKDARSRSVHLTPAGRRVFTATMPRWREAQREMQELLGSEALQHLHVILDDTLDLLATA